MVLHLKITLPHQLAISMAQERKMMIYSLSQPSLLGKCAYDYVEIMACPAGCLNGGGQIPLRDYPADKLALLTEAVGTSAAAVTAVGSSIRTQKLLLQHLDTVYREPVERAPRDAPVVQELYASFAPLASGPFSSGAREFLHTQYHHVEASEFAAGLGAKW